MQISESAKIRQLIDVAKETLIHNDTGKFTIPSGQLYPHMWAWDSAFAAMGWAHIDMQRAQSELETLLGHSWANGMLPHITFDHDHVKEYFPGPDVWGHAKSSTITQPPVWAIALEYLVKKGADHKWARDQIPLIERSHLFFKGNRDPNNLGMVTVAHPWESGMDNCVAWDRPLEMVPTEIRNKLKRVDNKKVKDPSQRPSDEEYRRYVRIVEELQTDENYLPKIFQIYDPMMSTILCLAESALARVQTILNIDNTSTLARAGTIKEAIFNLDVEDGYYQYIDANTQKGFFVKSLGAVFPYLLKGELPSELRRQHWGNFGLTTHNKTDESFDPNCYWRGPCWINTNWFFSKLDPGLENQILGLIEKSGFREYFHPESGAGLGAHKFSWSAALFLVIFDK